MGLHLKPHAHDVTTFSMVLRGGLREEARASAVAAGVFDVVVKPRGTTHENVFLDDAILVQVTPSEQVVRRAVDAGCPLRRWAWTDGMAAAPAFARLARFARGDVPDAVAAELPTAVDEALAALCSDEGRASGRPPPWLLRAKDALDEAARQGEVAPVGGLAADAGVHRVHLSREFRRWFGLSPTEYRTRARLRAAAGRLGASAESLSGTAYGAGYADQAHMTREFGRRLGLTPLEYRRLLALPTAGLYLSDERHSRERSRCSPLRDRPFPWHDDRIIMG